MKWTTICNSNLSNKDNLMIAEIKNQYWRYGIDSQIDWMKKNIKPNDYHLMGIDHNQEGYYLLAYLTLNEIQVFIDDLHYGAIGVGGVCVNKVIKGNGYGKQLMEQANRIILDKNRTGFLLCKDELVAFYEKCGWHILRFKQAFVSNTTYDYWVMVLNGPEECNTISFNRNF